MSANRLRFSLAVLSLLTGCAEMIMVTPQISSGSSERSVEVKKKVSFVTAVGFSSDGKRLVSAISAAGTPSMARIWDLENAKEALKIKLPSSWGTVDAAFSPDGKSIAISQLATMLGPYATRLWDTASGRQTGEIAGDFGEKMSYTGDGKYLFANGFPGPVGATLKLADMQTNKVVSEFKGYSASAIAPDGNSVALTKVDAIFPFPKVHLGLLDLKSGRETWQQSLGVMVHVTAIAFSPDGQSLLAASAEGLLASNHSIKLFDAATGNQIREVFRKSPGGGASPLENRAIVGLQFSPDGKYFLSLLSMGGYQLHETATGKVIREVKQTDEPMLMGINTSHASFSPNGRIVALAFNASTRLFDVASGVEIGNMIAFDDGEWLVTTPSGYYNSSEKGDEYLNVTVGGKPYSTAQLREAFFRPDLVKVALSGGTLSDYRKIADIRPPPAVAIVDTPKATAERKITVSLRVEDQGGGIGDVRLYRNGAAVVLEKTRSAAAAKAAQDGQVLRYEVSLEPGSNTIRAIAFNADNSMQSTDTTIDVQANIATRQPALHAIVIGIKDFANPRLALNYPVSDGELFANTLESRGKGLFSAIRVKRLFKPAETTNTAIVAALRQARHEVGPEDLFVFYVASHGTIDDGQYLLITSNVGSTTTARLKQDALTQDALKELISNIPASKKLVVLDTCSAGQLGDAIQVAMLTRGMSDDTATKVLSRAVGSTVLSAATSVQEALEGYKGHGLFTYVIVEGLNGAADADKDGFVKTLELADYVDNQVPELAEKIFKHKQYPIVSPTGQGFPLVKVR